MNEAMNPTNEDLLENEELLDLPPEIHLVNYNVVKNLLLMEHSLCLVVISSSSCMFSLYHWRLWNPFLLPTMFCQKKMHKCIWKPLKILKVTCSTIFDIPWLIIDWEKAAEKMLLGILNAWMRKLMVWKTNQERGKSAEDTIKLLFTWKIKLLVST